MKFRVAAMAAMLFALGLTGAAAASDDYPNRPIKIVMPFPAGGSADVVARRVAERLTPKLGQPVIIENRPGGGANIGAALVAQSAPDGYTLLWSTPGPLAINAALFKKLAYDPDAFVPISLVTTTPNVLVVHPGVAKSLPEFVAKAAAVPDQFSYASTGIGTTTHLSAELLKEAAGLKLVHVPYKGSPLVFPDLLSGRVHMFFMTLDVTLPYIRNGSLVVLGVGSEERSPLLLDVPALTERYPGFSSTTWSAVVGPAGTPPAVVSKLSAAIAEVMRQPDMAQPLLEAGHQPVGGGPEALKRIIQRDRAVWGGVIRRTGAVAE